MEKWEYASLGWYTDRSMRTVWFWRKGEDEIQTISEAAFVSTLTRAGQAGWELVTSTAIPKTAETLWFKRRSSQD